MKYAIILALAIANNLSFAAGALENPVSGGTESGIGVISGWHCTAKEITATIDAKDFGKAGMGTGRGDAASICGRFDSGYSLLFNYNQLTPGSHTLHLYADGQLLESRQFNTVQSGGAEFVTGLSKSVTIPDFPAPGKTSSLQWSQAKQSFVITGVAETPSQGVDMSSLVGAYTQTLSVSASGSSCKSYNVFSGSASATFNLTTNGSGATIVGYIYSDACTYHLSYVSGNSASGFNLSGTEKCSSGLSANVTASSLRMSGGRLYGTFTASLPGCTQTTSL
jgi:hypothetical protein